MNKQVMMECGHASNAIDDKGDPCCAICAGIGAGYNVVAKTPDLKGRLARCSYCRKTAPSNIDLPFFTHIPDKDYDDYYCGCRGWD